MSVKIIAKQGLYQPQGEFAGLLLKTKLIADEVKNVYFYRIVGKT